MALLLGVTASCVAMAEPELLSDAEMDTITAAGVVIAVDAYAAALGTLALTRTEARTLTSAIQKRIEIGIGFAEGQAYACCDEGASVVVGSSAAGSGDVVSGSSFSHVFHGAALTGRGTVEHFSFGYSAAWLRAASSDTLLGSRDLDRALGDLGDRLIDSVQTRSGDGPVTGFVFAPVYAAGLRWRAIRNVTGQLRDSHQTRP